MFHETRPHHADADLVLIRAEHAERIERIAGALDRRWLTNDGPLVQAFERRVAEYCGVRHCVAMALLYHQKN